MKKKKNDFKKRLEERLASLKATKVALNEAKVKAINNQENKDLNTTALIKEISSTITNKESSTLTSEIDNNQGKRENNSLSTGEIQLDDVQKIEIQLDDSEKIEIQKLRNEIDTEIKEIVEAKQFIKDIYNKLFNLFKWSKNKDIKNQKLDNLNLLTKEIIDYAKDKPGNICISTIDELTLKTAFKENKSLLPMINNSSIIYVDSFPDTPTPYYSDLEKEEDVIKKTVKFNMDNLFNELKQLKYVIIPAKNDNYGSYIFDTGRTTLISKNKEEVKPTLCSTFIQLGNNFRIYSRKWETNHMSPDYDLYVNGNVFKKSQCIKF